MRRALVFEPGRSHDEVIPTLVHHLQGLGFENAVFLGRANVRKDIFGSFGEDDRPRARVVTMRDAVRGARMVRRIAAAANRWSIEAIRADVVVLNTADGPTVARFRREHRKPRLLGVVHSGWEAAEDPVLVDAARKREVGLLVLAPHIQDYLERRGIPSYCIRPSCCPARLTRHPRRRRSARRARSRWKGGASPVCWRPPGASPRAVAATLRSAS
jgi:hypothetical protein